MVSSDAGTLVTGGKVLIRVLFFIHNLAGGGAERVMTHLLRNLDRSRFQVGLVVMEKSGSYLHLVPDDVPIFDLQVLEEKPVYFPKIVWRLRKIIKEYKPHIVFSMLWYANIAAVVATRFLKDVKTVISERTFTSYELENETVIKSLKPVKGWLIRNLYPISDQIVAVSKGVSDDLINSFGVSHGRITVINNPVDIAAVMSKGQKAPDPWDTKGFRILSVGRLKYHKGHDILIKAFAMSRIHNDAKLIILGEGPDRPSLEEIIRNEGLEDSVLMPGFQENPYAYLNYADLFILPSRLEGFPNALLEAMAFGLPVIAADCKTGPREILKDGSVCPLVPVDDPKALAEVMYHVLKDTDYRKELSKNSSSRVLDFKMSEQVGAYEALFENMVKRDK